MGHGWVYKTQEWKALRKRVLREETRCYLCGIPPVPNHPDKARRPSVDHVIALDNGGAPFERGNLRLACASCNARKGNRQGPIRVIKTSGSW